jgi:hypothetical protein
VSETKSCERCFFWCRIPHMLDFELGRCQLFEREMRAPQYCGMWEGRALATVTNETKIQEDHEIPLG